MDVIFKFAENHDFDEIVSHSKWWLDSAPTKQSFESLMKINWYYIVIWEWKIVWSFSIIQFWNDVLMIQLLRIKPDYRRRWIWRKILNYINSIAKDLWYENILSTVLINNEISLQFHKNIWFKESGIIHFETDEIVFLKDVI